MSSTPINFGLVQYPVIKGDIRLNLQNHIQHIEFAAKNGAHIVVFPELSLSGYEPELAKDLALSSDSTYIEKLSTAAKQNNVIVISGCPIKSENHTPYIGAIISYPDGNTDIYRKQFLHAGETDYFKAGDSSYFITCRGYKIALAICADFTNPTHWKKAKKQDADIYLASALISTSGFEQDNKLLEGHALANNIIVLLSNHNSETGGWHCCGKSRAWNAKGELAVSAIDTENSIVMCTVENKHLTGIVVEV